MRVLIVDNTIDRDSWGAGSLKRLALRWPENTVFVRRAPSGDLPKNLKRFDSLIISGSRTSCFEQGSWVTQLDELIRSTLNERKPILGVCYGHQALVRVVAGTETLGKGEVSEFGWTEIQTLSESSRLLNGLGKKFHSFSAHHEEVKKLPPGLRCVARSKDCAIQAFESDEQPIFGIQFHPERNILESEKTFSECRKTGSPSRLLNPGQGDRFYDSAVGETIFKNFFAL